MTRRRQLLPQRPVSAARRRRRAGCDRRDVPSSHGAAAATATAAISKSNGPSRMVSPRAPFVRRGDVGAHKVSRQRRRPAHHMSKSVQRSPPTSHRVVSWFRLSLAAAAHSWPQQQTSTGIAAAAAAVKQRQQQAAAAALDCVAPKKERKKHTHKRQRRPLVRLLMAPTST